LIGRCEFSEDGENLEEIYPNMAFVSKFIDGFCLEEFLTRVSGEGYSVSDKIPALIQEEGRNSWREQIIPSHATKNRYPGREYSADIGRNTEFRETILVGYGMPFYPSSTVRVQEFMGLRSYHGSSDGNNGKFNIEVPDRRGRIIIEKGKISVEGKGVNVCLVGKTRDQDNFQLKSGECASINEKHLDQAELWLLTEDNEALDFRSQTVWKYREQAEADGQLLEDDLLALIEKGEGHECEFKKYIEVTKNKNSKAEDIEKTVCALSNAQGGKLLIGVSDDGCIEGVDDKVKEHYQKKLEVAISDYIKDIRKRLCEILKDSKCFEICAVKVGGKHIVVLSVSRSDSVNYNVSDRLAHVRRGATSFKMASVDDREEIRNSVLDYLH